MHVKQVVEVLDTEGRVESCRGVASMTPFEERVVSALHEGLSFERVLGEMTVECASRLRMDVVKARLYVEARVDERVMDWVRYGSAMADEVVSA